MNEDNSSKTQRPPLVKPRRMLGPDCIKTLREFALTHTGYKYGFENCRIQRCADGGIAWRIQPELMEPVGNDEPDTYGHLIRKELVPLAEKLEVNLMVLTEAKRLRELNRLVRKAATGDGFIFWLLSTRSLRRLLFPAGYDTATGQRHDNVLYHYTPRDVRHCTKVILLHSLSLEDATHFANSAMHLTNETVKREHVMPVTLPIN